MSDSIERPSFGKWIGGLAALATAFIGVLVGCKVITPENLWMWVYGVLALATVGFLVHLLEWKITSRRRVSRSILDEQARALANETTLRLEKEAQSAKEEAQRAKVNEELAWREKQHEREREIARQEAREAEIAKEKSALDERIPCEGPLCTSGPIEWRSKHICAKRDMWDLDGKAVHADCFNSARGHYPFPTKDKPAFPPRFFAKEAAAEATTKAQQFARNKYRTLESLAQREGLTGEEALRADAEDPTLSEEAQRRARETLESLLQAKKDSGDI